ncbi:hypothetical protein BJV77DRAFT_1012170 [Russula vinacea]|nr:hypothetical protein BJV77DRAFT_1012170 [Russula vinacea]
MVHFRRPLLQRGFPSSNLPTTCQSPPHIGITILTNPARNQSHFVLHEEKTFSPTACRSSSLAPPQTYIIPSKPARTRSSPLIQNTHSSSPSLPHPFHNLRLLPLTSRSASPPSRPKHGTYFQSFCFPRSLEDGPHAEKIVRGLSLMIRSGSRLAAAHRRELPRNRR